MKNSNQLTLRIASLLQLCAIESNAEDLGAITNRLISEAIISNSDSRYTRFSSRTIGEIVAEQCRWETSYCEYQSLLSQLPPPYSDLGADAKVSVVYISACDAFPEEAGIPSYLVEDGFVNYLRLREALLGIGLDGIVTESEVAGLGWNYNLDDPDSRMKEFNKKLLSFFEAGKLQAPSILLDDSQCGGGEVTISFELREGLTRAKIIPELYYFACEGAGLSPFDTKKCIGWTDVASENLWISGVYVWQGQLPDGALVHGRIDVAKLADRRAVIPN